MFVFRLVVHVCNHDTVTHTHSLPPPPPPPYIYTRTEHSGHSGGLAHWHPTGPPADRVYLCCSGLFQRVLDQRYALLHWPSQAVLGGYGGLLQCEWGGAWARARAWGGGVVWRWSGVCRSVMWWSDVGCVRVVVCGGGGVEWCGSGGCVLCTDRKNCLCVCRDWLGFCSIKCVEYEQLTPLIPTPSQELSGLSDGLSVPPEESSSPEQCASRLTALIKYVLRSHCLYIYCMIVYIAWSR